MAQTVRQFKKLLIRKMARAAYNKAKPLIPSRTLRNALHIKYKEAGDSYIAYLQIPHYWALYVHDGRAAFGPRKAQVLVWFRNPRDDPRTSGGHPVRAADIRRLSKDEFYEGVRRNRAMGATPGNPFPYMVIARWRGGDKPVPFFSEGLSDLYKIVDPIVYAAYREFIRSNIFSDVDSVVGRF